MIDLNLDFEQKLTQVKTADSQTLAAYVVLYRALHIGEKLSKACMTELAARRISGDDFKFEEYIETEYLKIPKPQVNDTVSFSNLSKMLKNFKP